MEGMKPHIPSFVPHMAVPELSLSTSWVDFRTCFVNQGQVREVYLMKMSSCQSYWVGCTCPPCPLQAGTTQGVLPMAGSQTPSDSRVASPRGTGLDQKGTPELWGGGLSGAAHGAAYALVCSLPLEQASRSQTRTLGPSGYLQTASCWRHDWSTGPQIPSPLGPRPPS